MITEYGMSSRLGPVQYEGNHQVLVGRDYGQTEAYSERVALETDQEVCRVLMDAHAKTHEIIEAHREQHKLIAEKLLGCKTLGAKTVRSSLEIGKMPEGTNSDYPSEKKAQIFEEARRVLEEEETQKQVEEKQDFEEAKKESHDEVEEVRVEDEQTEKEVQSEEKEDPDSNPEYDRNNHEDRYK